MIQDRKKRKEIEQRPCEQTAERNKRMIADRFIGVEKVHEQFMNTGDKRKKKKPTDWLLGNEQAKAREEKQAQLMSYRTKDDEEKGRETPEKRTSVKGNTLHESAVRVGQV